jgi:hypothetical protein
MVAGDSLCAIPVQRALVSTLCTDAIAVDLIYSCSGSEYADLLPGFEWKLRVVGSLSAGTLIVGVAALCLAIAILAYRAEIDRTKVRIRHALFFTKRTQIRDAAHLVEERTLVLVTSTSKIPLWGLSLKARETLFQILPPSSGCPSRDETGRRIDSNASVRKHLRWTIVAGVGFLVTSSLVVPFFKGNALHNYWNGMGQYLLLLCLCFFSALAFEAGFTGVLWSTKRDIDRIEKRHARRRLVSAFGWLS